MKHKKKKAKLEARIKDYEKMVAVMDPLKRGAFKKPGSVNK